MSTEFQELLAKHVSGTLNEEEQKAFGKLLRFPENQLYLASQIDKEFAAAPTETKGDEEVGNQVLQRILHQIGQEECVHQQEASIPTAGRVIRLPWYRRSVVRLAAAVAAACVLGLLFFNSPWTGGTTGEEPQTVTVAADATIRKAILPDGTLVWVKPGSVLDYPLYFPNGKREVALRGEALFEVAKDTQRPFTVHCNTMNVRVLGTSFHISDRKLADTVEVAVLTGKVWVDPSGPADGSEMVLLPNDRMRFHRTTGKANKSRFEAAGVYTDGTAYDMRFIDTPIENIARRIEKKFDVVVRLKKSSGDCRVSGNFTDQSLLRTIDVLSKTLGASYAIDRDTVKISQLACQ